MTGSTYYSPTRPSATRWQRLMNNTILLRARWLINVIFIACCGLTIGAMLSQFALIYSMTLSMMPTAAWIIIAALIMITLIYIGAEILHGDWVMVSAYFTGLISALWVSYAYMIIDEHPMWQHNMGSMNLSTTEAVLTACYYAVTTVLSLYFWRRYMRNTRMAMLQVNI